MAIDLDRWNERDLGAERLSAAVLDALCEDGLAKTTAVSLANRLKCSRSAFYKQYRSREVAFLLTHQTVLRTLDERCCLPWLDGSRRAQFELLWHRLVGFLVSPRGRAFRALRHHLFEAATLAGPVRFEFEDLPALARWLPDDLDYPAARVRAVFSLCLTAADLADDERDTEPLREAAWSVVCPLHITSLGDDVEDELSVAQPRRLGALLGSPVLSGDDDAPWQFDSPFGS